MKVMDGYSKKVVEVRAMFAEEILALRHGQEVLFLDKLDEVRRARVTSIKKWKRTGRFEVRLKYGLREYFKLDDYSAVIRLVIPTKGTNEFVKEQRLANLMKRFQLDVKHPKFGWMVDMTSTDLGAVERAFNIWKSLGVTCSIKTPHQTVPQCWPILNEYFEGE